jgi:hypothetical protein
MTKLCSHCGTVKSLEAFHRRASAPDGRRSKCKDCVNEVNRQAYRRNPEGAAERHRRWRERNPDAYRALRKRVDATRDWANFYARIDERREMLDAYKRTQGCADCGTSEGRLDFDHRPKTEKRFSIAVGLTRSWDVIWAEVAKCDVRCASCHTKHHAALRKAAI